MLQTMMKERPVNIVGGCKFGRYPKISDEQTYNMYVSDDWLISFSGWKKVSIINKLTGSSGRGQFVSTRSNIILAVINSVVYSITINNNYSNYSYSRPVVSFVGNISSSVGPVFMDENLDNQIAIVDGLNCYIYNTAFKSLTKQVINVDLIPNYVCYHDTYFLFGNALRTKNGVNIGNGAKWYAFSPATDSTIVYAKELALQTKPDYAIAVTRIPGSANNIMVFGYTVAEIWTQTGGAAVYQRNQSLNVDYGCLSVSTIATSDRYVMWLAVNENNSPVIMLFSGNQNVAISTDGIDYLLGRIKYPEQSTGYFFRKDGHLFYILTFYNSADNLSLCYDTETKLFSFLSDSNMNYFPPRSVVHYNNKSYFISINNGALYEISPEYTTYDENIGPIRLLEEGLIPRIRICSPIRLGNASRFRSRNLTLTIDQGNDQEFTGINLLPQETFLISEDGNQLMNENSEFLINQDILGQFDYAPFMASQDGDTLTSEDGSILITEDAVRQHMPAFYAPRIEMCFSVDGASTFSSTVSNPMRILGQRFNIMNFPGHFGAANDLTFKIYFYTKSHVCSSNATLEIF